MKVKSPREANGPDGYPKYNPEFRRLANKVIADRKKDAAQAKKFLKRLAKACNI